MNVVLVCVLWASAFLFQEPARPTTEQPAEAPAAVQKAENGEPPAAAAVQSPLPRSSFDPIKPRPERTAEERAKFVEELRAAYAKPSSEWPAPTVDPGVEWKEVGLLPKPEHPADNPHSKEKENLGKTLFFDPRLSGSGQLACASCHDPDLGWADGRVSSFGHARVPLARNAPSIRNTAYQPTLFWDGRAASLEEQAVQVLMNPSEMRADPADVTTVLGEQPEYRTQFKSAFGDEAVTIDRVAKALACFERSITSGRSRFDRFAAGKPETFTDSELVGLDLFRRDARCLNCHSGPAFTDGKFHNVGLSYYGRKLEDLGRYQQTKAAADVGAFRTPSLRDITATRPLMHNGLFELPGVLNMYNAGMPTLRPKADQLDDPLFPKKSPLLRPLGLNRQDLGDLQAFLETLEEPRQRVWSPDLPGLHKSRLSPAVLK